MRNGSGSETKLTYIGKFIMKELTRENVTYEDLMNICHCVDEYLQNCGCENKKMNELKQIILNYEFSKFQEDLDDCSLFDLMISTYME